MYSVKYTAPSLCDLSLSVNPLISLLEPRILYFTMPAKKPSAASVKASTNTPCVWPMHLLLPYPHNISGVPEVVPRPKRLPNLLNLLMMRPRRRESSLYFVIFMFWYNVAVSTPMMIWKVSKGIFCFCFVSTSFRLFFLPDQAWVSALALALAPVLSLAGPNPPWIQMMMMMLWVWRV